VTRVAKTADQWFAAYSESHRNPVNKAIHWVAVPCIFLSVVGLLWSLPTPGFVADYPLANWALPTTLLTLVFYLRLSPAIAAGMALFCLVCLLLAGSYVEAGGEPPLRQASLALFVIMWVFQFIGHHIEGRKPSFFQDLQFLLIGPAWLLHFIYRRLGIRY
jgi:uncharacterized membrane protein YGL010W